MTICRECGVEFDGGLFCPNCGTKNENNSETDVALDENLPKSPLSYSENLEEDYNKIVEERAKQIELDKEQEQQNIKERKKIEKIQQKVQKQERKKQRNIEEIEIGNKAAGISFWSAVITTVAIFVSLSVGCGLYMITGPLALYQGIKAIKKGTDHKVKAVLGLLFGLSFVAMLIFAAVSYMQVM